MKLKIFGRILLIEFVEAEAPEAQWYTTADLCEIMNMNRTAVYMWCMRSGFKTKKHKAESHEYYVPKENIKRKIDQLKLKRLRMKCKQKAL